MAPLPLWQHNKEEEEEMERKRASEASLHSGGLLPGTMSLRCPFFLLKTNTRANTHRDKSFINTHTHTLKSLSNILSISLIICSLFSDTAVFFVVFFLFVVTGVIQIHYAQCQYWCNNTAPPTGTACWMSARAVRRWEKRGEAGEEIRDARHGEQPYWNKWQAVLKRKGHDSRRYQAGWQRGIDGIMLKTAQTSSHKTSILNVLTSHRSKNDKVSWLPETKDFTKFSLGHSLSGSELVERRLLGVLDFYATRL